MDARSTMVGLSIDAEALFGTSRGRLSAGMPEYSAVEKLLLACVVFLTGVALLLTFCQLDDSVGLGAASGLGVAPQLLESVESPARSGQPGGGAFLVAAIGGRVRPVHLRAARPMLIPGKLILFMMTGCARTASEHLAVQDQFVWRYGRK